jgi:hypothetical protein
LDLVHYFPDKTSEQLELPPLSTRRKIARITLLHKAIHEKVAIPLNQRELRDSIIRRDTYKSDRKKMFTNTVSSHVTGIGTNYQMNC